MRPRAGDEPELALCAAISLRFVICFVVDFSGEGLWFLGAAEHAVLAVREVGLEGVLREREADDEFLPRKKRAVEGVC